uniref:Methyltransf_21 domain-containing protein n=1 Tax=Steinernema glaseri TaxID=37863 RepID=A0A1I7ZAZ2_9BILA
MTMSSTWEFRGAPVKCDYDSDFLVILGECYDTIFDEALTAASESHRCAWLRREALTCLPNPQKMKNALELSWLRKVRIFSGRDTCALINSIRKNHLKPHTIIVEVEIPHLESLAGQFASFAHLAQYVVASRKREKQALPTFPVIAYIPEPTAEAPLIATLFSSCVLRLNSKGDFDNIALSGNEKRWQR